MWEYILGGATVFGLIVTLGAWINGRMTRGVMMEYFNRMDKRFDELLKRMDERLNELIKQHNELIKQHSEILKRLETFRE